jgi:septal ring factor EnvC (AmiA/AmiB activator)
MVAWLVPFFSLGGRSFQRFEVILTFIVMLVLLLPGCVSEDKYVFRKDYEALQEQMRELNATLESLQSSYADETQLNAELENEIGTLAVDLNRKTAELVSVQSDLSQATKEISDLKVSLQAIG